MTLLVLLKRGPCFPRAVNLSKVSVGENFVSIGVLLVGRHFAIMALKKSFVKVPKASSIVQQLWKTACSYGAVASKTTILKTTYVKKEPKIIKYRNNEKFSHEEFLAVKSIIASKRVNQKATMNSKRS